MKLTHCMVGQHTYTFRVFPQSLTTFKWLHRSVKNIITVVSSDGDEFEMTVGVAKQSELLKRMLKECAVVGKVPLFNVNTPILVKVMEYCQKHANYGAVAAEANGGASDAAAELKAWDAEFVNNEDMDMVLNILIAANVLNIQVLLDLTYKTIADMIKEKSLEQIQQIFGTENDFTAEEEDQTRKQNHGAFNPNIINL